MPLTLMSVPREIRNNILKQLLLEQKEVYPYAYDDAACECFCCGSPTPPDVSIMRVNKSLNAEATEILYPNAIFIMRSGIQFARFFDRRDTACLHEPPKADQMYPSRHLIKRITFNINPEISYPSAHLSRVKHMWADPGFKHLSARERKREVHEGECAFNMLTWGHNMRLLQELCGLKHIVIDIKGLFCTHGCCRMTHRLCRNFKNLKFKPGLRFAITGQVRHGENESFAIAIERCGKEITVFYDARDNFHDPDDDLESEHEDSDDDLDSDSSEESSEIDSEELIIEDENEGETSEDDSMSEEQEYYPAE